MNNTDLIRGSFSQRSVFELQSYLRNLRDKIRIFPMENIFLL
ncbi:Uncharacterized protein dnm_092120 [Desulfonema magnum]|uniref:Uncharacterized protein n=1 Tax=Desulfonema magnum TaxID=45655 RepID=A0A975BXR3_9BACT|nr:Uncharacterized protein dnm_092120 [Desulfonema magnum]